MHTMTGDIDKPLRREHALVACPPVFSYHLSIKAEFEALGYTTTWWNDRGSDSTLYKAGLRLLPQWMAQRSTAEFLRRLDRLDTQAISRVLVVKGEGMSVDFIQALRRRLPNARLSLYFWDSVANAPHARIIAPFFDSVATFDSVDAAALNWRYRPLFARNESVAPAQAAADFRYDWCFIGTLHSDRYRVVERLRRSAPRRKAFFFGFAPNRLLLLKQYLSDPALLRRPAESVSHIAMPAAAVASAMSASRAMLDVEHPRQRGLTMRTIETLLSGRKLITTNSHVVESDLFDPSRIYVINRHNPSVPDEFFTSPFVPIDAQVRRQYSLKQWITDLTGVPVYQPTAVG